MTAPNAKEALREKIAKNKLQREEKPKPPVEKPKPVETSGSKDKAIDRMASKVLADLQAGNLVDHRSKKPLTKTISNRALGGYTTSSDSRKAILKNLEKRGVVEFRGGKAHIVESYLPSAGPKPDDVISALTNTGIAKKEAQALTEATNGNTEAEWIKNALKKSLPMAS